MTYDITTYIDDEGFKVTEYRLDGKVTHTIRTIGSADANDTVQVLPSIEEQILTENQYQTALLEMNMLGGGV